MRWLPWRALAFPALLLGALEWWSRTAGRHSDALAAPSAAAQALGKALADGSLLGATAFTLGSAALGLALACLAGVALAGGVFYLFSTLLQIS